MKTLVFILISVFVSALPACAAGTVLWLGGITAEDRTKWQGANFSVVELACGESDTGCIEQAIRKQADKPVYLFGRSPHTAAVLGLYQNEITTADLEGIVLLRSQAGEPPKFAPYDEAPELVIFVEQSDPRPSIVSTRKLAASLRDKGVDATFLFANDGMLRGMSLHQITFDILMHLTGNSPFTEQFAQLIDLERQWQTPLFNNDDFYTKPEYIKTQDPPPIFKELINAHYQFELHRAKQLEMSTFQTFDLLAYRDEIAPGAQYVTFRNRRGQIYYLDLEVYADYGPVVVTGIDDVTNLFRLAWFYRTKAMYSWKPDVQNISVRPLGPVLFFEKEADIPGDLVIPLLVRSALTLEGIEFWSENPLASIAAYPPEVQKTITTANKCVYCHQIEKLNARHHHLDAKTGEPQGGFGLPLVDYPDEVIQSFLYDQEKTAKKIGMTPNPLGEDVVQIFDDWLAALPQPPSIDENLSDEN